ncbi:MAG: hypothetical protein HY532_02675 [Chloroflexi bacterium]|nr:hypothetical protein [Chloroflexota bacterium]
MSKEAVLARVDADVRSGDLGRVRDRLHTLIYHYPNDVALRSRLAEVYQKLQFPAMAGRYWYLEERRTTEIEASIAAFERSCGGDPLLMLSALKFRGDPDDIPDHAREHLQSLRQAVQDRYGFFPDAYAPSRRIGDGRVAIPKGVRETQYRQMLRRGFPRQGFYQRGFISIGHRLVALHVVLAGAVIMALALTGLLTIARWVVQALR